MAQGNSGKMQFSLEATYSTVPTLEKQVRFSSEGFKWVPTKKEEGLLTGGKATGREYIMAKKAEGELATTVRPDEAGYWLALTLGAEAAVAPVAGSTGAYKHTFKSIGTGLLDSLPSAFFAIDRIVSVKGYTGCKVDTLSFSAAPEDYLTLDLKVSGKDEVDATLEALSPSPLKPFRFSHGTVKMAETTVADVTSIKFDYNNALESNIQTTSTGYYYKEPEAGPREIKTELEVLFTEATEALRDTYYKEDAALSVELFFESNEEIESGFPYSLKIVIPHNEMTNSEANIGGPERLRQTISLNAFESGSDELITVELINGYAEQYIEESTG